MNNNAQFDRNKDYFPYKTKIKYAKGYTVQYFNNYKVLNIINPFNGNRDTLQYVLVQRGTTRPSGHENASFIEIPIRNLVCLSSTHIGLTDLLDVNHLVIGLSDTSYICNEKIKQRIKENKITPVGRAETLNNEQLISMNPDLLMTVGLPGAKMSSYNTLMESGIQVIVNSEWMESSPLGRTEWVKLLAVLLNKEKLADEKFKIIEKKYYKVSRIANSVSIKPKIISGNSFKGMWYVPGGKSYTAEIFKDAGANYYWSYDKSTGSLHPSFEDVYEKGLEADFWFYQGKEISLKGIAEQDDRFKKFKSFKNGTIYNNTERANKFGGNDYWESGLVNPHLILSDIIKIVHPELLPDYTLMYYKKIQ